MEVRRPGWTLWVCANPLGPRHVIPDDDLLPHHVAEDCPCEPRLEWVYGEGNLPIRRIYAHSAYDRRE